MTVMTHEEFMLGTISDEPKELVVPNKTMSHEEFFGTVDSLTQTPDPDPISDLPPGWQSFLGGMSRMAADTSRIPAIILDAALGLSKGGAIGLTLVRSQLEASGIQVLDQSPDWLIDNPLALYFDEKAASFAFRTRKYPEDDLVSLVQSGRYEDAGEYLFHSVLENAPNSMVVLAGGWAGFAGPALGLVGAQVAAQTNAAGRRAGLDALDSATAGILNGGFEILFERWGTLGMFEWGKRVVRDVGEITAKSIFKATAKIMARAMVVEGIEEVETQLAQDLTNKVFEIEDIPWGDFPRRAIEAGAIGSVSGAVITSPAAVTAGLENTPGSQDKARAEDIIERLKPLKPPGEGVAPAEPTEAAPAVPIAPAEAAPVAPPGGPAAAVPIPAAEPGAVQPAVPLEGAVEPTPAEVPEGEEDISFDFGENVAQQIAGAVTQLPEDQQDALALEVESEILKERLAFRQRVGRFRKFAKGELGAELAAIPRSFITRDPNASTIDKKAQELGFESGEALRETILAFEQFKPGGQARLQEILQTLRSIQLATSKAKTAEAKAARSLFQSIERLLARRLPASAVKGIVRRATGQAKGEVPTITESQALKRSLERQQQVTRQAAIETKRQQKEAQQLLRKIKTADIQNITAQARAEIQELQKELKTARTLEALRDLNRRVQAIKDRGKQTFAVTKDLRDRAFALDRDILVETVTKGEPVEPKPFTQAEKLKGVKREAIANVRTFGLRAPRMLDFLDGFQDFLGPFYQVFYDRFNLAFSSEVSQTKAATELGLSFLTENEITADELVATATFRGVTVNFQEMMHVYAGFGNNETRAAIAFGNNIPLEVQQEIIAFLPSKYKRAADQFVKELDANYPRTRIAMLDFSGGKTDLGRVKGPYIPMLRQDRNYESTDEEILADLAARQGLAKAFAPRGFTEARIKVPAEFQTPIRLGLVQVYFDHVAKREHFIETGLIVKDLQRLANDRKLSEAIRQKRGQPFLDQLRNYVNRLANPNIYKAYSQLDRLVRSARERSAIVHLGLNVVTMMKQVPSLILFLNEVGPIDLMNGIQSVIADFEGSVAFVNARDSQMENRQIERELEEFKRTDPAQFARTLGRLSKESFSGIRIMDRVAITAGWLGMYQQMIRLGASESEAIRRAQGAVLRTQPAAAAKDIAEIYATNEFVNMFTQFTNQLNQIFNIVTHDIPSRGLRGKTDKALLGGMAVAINSLIIWSLAHGRLPEDPEELSDAALDTMIAMLPVVGPMLNSYRHGFEGLPAALDLMVKKPFQTAQSMVKGDFGSTLDNGLYLTAFLLKIPYTQVRRSVLGAYDLLEGETDDFRRLIFSEFALKKKGGGGAL